MPKRGFGELEPVRLTNETIREWVKNNLQDLAHCDVSEVTDMSGLFQDVSSPLPDLSRWNVSNVRFMTNMFRNCNQVPDVSMWDVSKVVTFESMFEGCCRFNQSLNYWKVGKATNMKAMFRGCTRFNQPLWAWEVGSVITFASMFEGCFAFNQPVGSWNVRSAVTMERMFFDCGAFNQPLHGWRVGRVQNMNRMFAGCGVFNRDLRGWDVSNVIIFFHMFHGCVLFNQPLGGWNVSSAVKMAGMFSGCRAFNQPLNGWNVSRVTSMTGMFFGCEAFNQRLDRWDVSQVTSMMDMFQKCVRFNQPLATWNVAQVTTMEGMFMGCHSFNQPLEGWNTSRVQNMAFMFKHCRTFNQPLGGWDVSQVTRMRFMFGGCWVFNQPLAGWAVGKVTDMSGMFSDTNLFQQPLESWDVSSVTNMSGMFECSEYQQPLALWDVSSVTNMSYMFQYSPYQQPLMGWQLNTPRPLMVNMFAGYEYNYRMLCLEAWQVNLADFNEWEEEYEVVTLVEDWLQQFTPPPLHPRPIEPAMEENIFDVATQTEQSLHSWLFHPDGSPQDVFLILVNISTDRYQPVVMTKASVMTHIVNPLRALTHDSYQSTLKKAEAVYDFTTLPMFMKWIMVPPDTHEAFLKLDFTSALPNLLIPLSTVTTYSSSRGITVLQETNRTTLPALNLFERFHLTPKVTPSFVRLECQPCESWTMAPTPPPTIIEAPTTPSAMAVEVVVNEQPPISFPATIPMSTMLHHLFPHQAVRFVMVGKPVEWIPPAVLLQPSRTDVSSLSLVEMCERLLGQYHSSKLHLRGVRTIESR